MKQFLTIREFAKLRNVDINSLRYYEKLNILKPAWIDPKTKYRYYSPDQLVTLDIIILCIRIGIPLKKLEAYIDDNGSIDKKRILEDGKAAMQERVSEMQTGLELIQFNLDNMDGNQAYQEQKGIYTRTIPERFLMEKPFTGDWSDMSQKETSAMELFHDAQEKGLSPVFPAGILVHLDAPENKFSFFFQVLHPSPQEPQILHIPKGTYSCLQVDLTPETKLLELLSQNFPQHQKGCVIISNMLLNKLRFNSRHSEIQVSQF